MSKRALAFHSKGTLAATPNLIPPIGKLGVGLCLALVAFAAPAAVADLLSQSAWRFYGSGAVRGGTLTVGDNIGYDTSDSDRDGNPYNLLFGDANTTATSNQGVDYDEAVSVAEFSPPFKLSWTGCFPSTSYGYNNIFIGRKNPSYTGAAGSKQYMITQEFGYTARWDYSGMNSVVLNAGSYDVQKVSAASLSGNNYCGNYRIDWANDQLDFYFNGTKIRTQRYAFIGPVSILVRSFERPHSITAMTLEDIATAQKPATGQGLAAIYGANISGTIRDQSSGKMTTLDTSNTAISGDVSFATNAAGNLMVHISGKGAAQGMAFRYEVDYDVATANLTGTVADNTDNATRPITFTHKGGLTWEARVAAGGGKSSSGTATAYDIVFNIVLPPESVTMGSKWPANGRVNVDLNNTQAISVPVSVSQVGLNTTFSTSIITEGLMVVSLVPNSLGSFALTGSVEGSFRVDPPIQVSIPYTPFPGFSVNIAVTVDPTGRFSGVLTGDTAKNNLSFTGNWTAVSSDGSTAGGTLEMKIPLDPKTYAVPATAELSIEGAVTSPINVSGLPSGFSLPISIPSSVTTPFSQKVTVPLNFRAPN
jgi:hypothetical protein